MWSCSQEHGRGQPKVHSLIPAALCGKEKKERKKGEGGGRKREAGSGEKWGGRERGKNRGREREEEGREEMKEDGKGGRNRMEGRGFQAVKGWRGSGKAACGG